MVNDREKNMHDIDAYIKYIYKKGVQKVVILI